MLTNEELPSEWIKRRAKEMLDEAPLRQTAIAEMFERHDTRWKALLEYLDQAALDSHPPFRHSQEV